MLKHSLQKRFVPTNAAPDHPDHNATILTVSQTCQAESWKAHHKYECKAFNRLRPHILPNAVRVVMQLLHRRKAGSLPDDEWKSFLELQSHIEEFRSQRDKQADGLTRWKTIQVMSQAALSYSESRESLLFICTIVARVRSTSSLSKHAHHQLPARFFDPNPSSYNDSMTPFTGLIKLPHPNDPNA